jgi:hypothetical protein
MQPMSRHESASLVQTFPGNANPAAQTAADRARLSAQVAKNGGVEWCDEVVRESRGT